MNAKYLLIILLLSVGLVSSCSDDDSFTTSSQHRLVFSEDTIKLDTVFSNVPTPAKSFWVYNKSGDGLRCTNIRLEHGNQTGFRVNVDGTYLGASVGYQMGGVEIRNKDSIRVFVELTSPYNYKETAKYLEDNLLFTLESGITQRVNLNAWSWDARLLHNVHIKKDSVISGEKPIVIYGGIKVDTMATLTIKEGTTLYFHNDAGIDVYGRLICEGTAEKNVVLRGDRIDHMFDYLPYDYVTGQWQGIHFYGSSYDNELIYTDIHSTFDGIIVDSCDVNRLSLSLLSSTVHNCQGYGVMATNSQVLIENSQITNTLKDCLYVNGGLASVNNCTLAQFYPFDANRGVALRFSARQYALEILECQNSLITGYADDEMMGEGGDSLTSFNYYFSDCIIRTPKITTDDSLCFVNVLFEDIKDTLHYGQKHFMRIDTDSLRYDFRLDTISPAIDRGNPLTSLPLDRNGIIRDDKPDIGAFERIKNN